MYFENFIEKLLKLAARVAHYKSNVFRIVCTQGHTWDFLLFIMRASYSAFSFYRNPQSKLLTCLSQNHIFEPGR